MKNCKKFKAWVKTMGGSTQCAAKLGVCATSVQFWMSGKQAPGRKNIAKILALSKGHITYTDILG